MGNFNAKVGGQTNTSERATGCFGLGQRNEGRMCNIKEIQDYEHTLSKESREEMDMEKPYEIDYITTLFVSCEQ